MNTSNPQQPTANILPILWGVLLWSCCIWTRIVYLKFKGSIFSLEEFSQHASQSYPLFIAALLVFFGARFIFKILLKNNTANASQSMKQMQQKYFVPFVLKIVLFEFCTLLGFVLSFSTQKRLILPFFILSLIGFLISFPSKLSIERDLLRRAV